MRRKPFAVRRVPFLLVAKSILSSAVRALPGDGIAGHAPEVFFHTILTDFKSAAALPAKGKFPAAAMANLHALFAVLFPVSRLEGWFVHGCRFMLLLI